MTDDIKHMLEKRDKLTNNLRILDEAIVEHARLHLEAEHPEVQDVIFDWDYDGLDITVWDKKENVLRDVETKLEGIFVSLNNVSNLRSWQRDDDGHLG